MDRIVSIYTRQQAIKDGVLIDITSTSEVKEADFKVPVCLTSSVYELVIVPEKLKNCQDFKGRLWDICFMAVYSFKRFKDDKHLVPFKVAILQKNFKLKTFQLWLVFNEHEGFTIMLPEDY